MPAKKTINQPAETKQPETDKPSRQELLREELGDDKTYQEFLRFKDKNKQREIRRDIEFKVSDILEGELREENMKALEILNKVYRKAWTRACKALGFPEEEFPSKY